MSWSTLLVLIIAALILYISLRLVAGVLRLIVGVALLGVIGFGIYWVYMQFTGSPVSSNDFIPFLK